MPAEQSSDVRFEIGHVLFIDIVGYSKLLITEQSEQLQTLKKIVRGTENLNIIPNCGCGWAFTAVRSMKSVI